MKKITMILAFAGLTAVSCGDDKGGDKEGEDTTGKAGSVSICDCVEGQEEMTAKLMEIGGDEEKSKEIEAEYKDIMDACKKMGEEMQEEMEGLSDDEKQAKGMEMMAEMEKCRK